MKFRTVPLLVLFVLAAKTAFTQGPSVNTGGVVNLASLTAGPVAPGSLVTIFGTNFVSESLPSPPTTIPLPTTMNGVSVTFGGISAPLLYVSPGQINAQLPWELTPGSVVSVVVKNSAGSSAPRKFGVGTSNPGVFTFQSGTGQAIATNLDGSLASPSAWIPFLPTHSATPGDTLTIYATGLGAVTPPIANGTNASDQVRQNTLRPKVLIGGLSATVTFCGLSPEFVGVNQINVVVPTGIANGGAIPLQLSIGNLVTTDKTTIAVGVAPPPGQIPSNYLSAYSNLQSRLYLLNDALYERWNGAKYPVIFGAELTPADYYAGITQKGYYDAKIVPYLNALQFLGAKTVKFQLGFPMLYQPFFHDFRGDTNDVDYNARLAFYQQLVADLRSRGIKVIVQSAAAPATGGTATSDPFNLTEYYKSLTLDQYISGRAANILKIAQALAPDYINIEPEPDNEGTKSYRPELSDPSVNLRLVKAILNSLESAGIPGLHTKILIAAGCGSWTSNYQTYVTNYTSLPSIDIFDIHVHTGTLIGPSDPLINIFTIASAAKAAGKKVGMNEDWVDKIDNDETGNPDEAGSRNAWSFWAPIDQMFIQSMVNTAYYEQMEYLSFNGSDTFFAYLDYYSTPGCPTEVYNSCKPAEWNAASAFAVSNSLSQNPVPVTDTGKAFAAFIK